MREGRAPPDQLLGGVLARESELSHVHLDADGLSIYPFSAFVTRADVRLPIRRSGVIGERP